MCSGIVVHYAHVCVHVMYVPLGEGEATQMAELGLISITLSQVVRGYGRRR